MMVMASNLALGEITPWSCQSRTGGPQTRWLRIFSASSGDDLPKAQTATSSMGVVGRMGRMMPATAMPRLSQPMPR